MSFQSGCKPPIIGAHRTPATRVRQPPLSPIQPPVVPSGDPIKDIGLRLERMERLMTNYFIHLGNCINAVETVSSEGFDAVLASMMHRHH